MTLRLLPAAVAIVAVCAASPALAQDAPSQKASKPNDKAAKANDSYDAMLQQYLAEARASVVAPTSPDSLWMAGLTSDLRARRVNDLVTIRVIENVSGLGAADSNLDKRSNATVGVGHLFGLESHLPNSINPQNLASVATNTNFEGGGSTSRTGSLTAVLTARVAEVLPNGDLLVQGVREIDINGDRQMLVLTGVVRTADINAANVIPSTAIGQMRIRYFGRGLMQDNLSPGWLIKILNKIF
jgi:flagellar L-ring protein precursor FlgH